MVDVHGSSKFGQWMYHPNSPFVSSLQHLCRASLVEYRLFNDDDGGNAAAAADDDGDGTDKLLLDLGRVVQQNCNDMVNEFYGDEDNDGNIKNGHPSTATTDATGWQTLPQRIHTLVGRMDDVLEIIHSNTKRSRILFRNTIDNDDDATMMCTQQNHHHNNNDNDHRGTTTSTTTTTPRVSFQDLSTIITASLLLDGGSGDSRRRCCLIPWFENFLVAALFHQCSCLQMETDNEKSNELFILQNLFGSVSTATNHEDNNNNNSDRSHPVGNDGGQLTVIYSHLRRLGWIQQPRQQTSLLEGLSSTTTSGRSGSLLLHEPLWTAVQTIVSKKVRGMIVGNYDTDTMTTIIHHHNSNNKYISNDSNTTTTTQQPTTTFQSIIHWANQMIVPWLCYTVYGMDDEQLPPMISTTTINNNDNNSIDSPIAMDDNINNKYCKEIQEQVQLMVIQTYWSIRLHEIFDIVTSYPDSLPAIVELQVVLNLYVQKSIRSPLSTSSSTSLVMTLDNVAIQHCYEQLIQELSQSLRQSFIVRLNHPGANTTQMIDVYIAAIQVLRKLLLPNDNNRNDQAQSLVLPSTMFSISSNHMNTVIAYTTEPVRSYLKNYRNDTVRCILTSLTSTTTTAGNRNGSDGNTNTDDGSRCNHHVLYQELRRQDTKPLEYMTMNSDDEDDDEEECPTMDWQPRPSIYSHTYRQQQKSHHHRTTTTASGGGSGSSGNNSSTKNDSDILAMLVSIYGSKELFVNEYRSMLADKLLSSTGSNYNNNGNSNIYTTDQDVHTLELLKLRFGEMSLINAEVMIKDIEDSVRINKNIRDAYMTKKKNSIVQTSSLSSSSSSSARDEEPEVVVVDAAIVSHIFWPKLHTSSLKHHPRIQILLDEYATIYAEQKNPRLLQWYNHLGSIQLELDVAEEHTDVLTGKVWNTLETKEFSCSPLLATLISHFEDESTWTAEQLSNETSVPDHIIVKQMSYWVTQRVVTYHSSSGSSIPSTSVYDTSKSTYTLASKMEQSMSTR